MENALTLFRILYKTFLDFNFCVQTNCVPDALSDCLSKYITFQIRKLQKIKPTPYLMENENHTLSSTNKQLIRNEHKYNRVRVDHQPD